MLFLNLLILIAVAYWNHPSFLLVKVETNPIRHVHFVGVPIQSELLLSFLFFIGTLRVRNIIDYRYIGFISRVLLLVHKLTLNLGAKFLAVRGHTGLRRVDGPLDWRNQA